MKKSLSLVLLVACAALMLPVAAFASSADADDPVEATTYEQGIHEMEMPGRRDCESWLFLYRARREKMQRAVVVPMEIIRTRVLSGRWTRQEFISRLSIIPVLVQWSTLRIGSAVPATLLV